MRSVRQWDFSYGNKKQVVPTTGSAATRPGKPGPSDIQKMENPITKSPTSGIVEVNLAGRISLFDATRTAPASNSHARVGRR